MKKTQRDRHAHQLARLRRHLAICRDFRKRRSVRKRAARYATALAEQLGFLNRPSRCQWCQQDTDLERHHWDYTDPLLVTFLCAECHLIANRIIQGPPARLDEPVILPFRPREGAAPCRRFAPPDDPSLRFADGQSR